MLRGRASVGVEISDGAIRLAKVVPGAVPKVLDVREIHLHEGDGRRVGRMVQQALADMDARNANIHIAFAPPPFGTLRHSLFTGPKLTRRELRQVAQREARKDPQIEAAKVYVEAEAVDTVSIEGGVKAQRYLLLAISRDLMDSAINALTDAKLVLRSMTSVAMGVLRASSLVDLPDSKCTAVLQVDERRSLLMVLENGVPMFFREFPIELRASGSGTEYLAEALAREVELSLVYFAQQHRPKRVDTVVVVGSSEHSQHVSDWIEERSGYAVARLEANDKLQVDAKVTGPLAPFAGAIGVALGKQARPVPDLLPPELRARPERILGVMAGAAIVVAFLFFCMHLRTTHTDRLDAAEARVTQLMAELTALEPKIEEAARYDKEAVNIARWRGYFEGVEKHQRQWARFLVELADKTPPRIHYTQLETTTREGKKQFGKPTREAILKLSGVTRGLDAREAQQNLRTLVKAAEELPTVKSTFLPSLPRPYRDDKLEHIAFSLELAYDNPFPKGGR